MAQPTLAVIDGNSNPQTVFTINPNGSATSANSQPVVIASDQGGALATIATNTTNATTDTAAATVSVSANTQNVNTTNYDLMSFQVTAISGTLNLKASVDGIQTPAPFFAVPVAGGAAVSAIVATGIYQADCGAIDQIQFQSAGTATIVYVMSSTGTVVTVDNFPATTGANNADAQATVSTGLSASLGFGYLFNGTTWDRQREVSGDAQAAAGITSATGMLWNGTTYDRQKGINGSSQVLESGFTVANTTALTTANLDLLTLAANGWYDTQNSAASVTLDLFNTSTGTGVVTFEQTNDTTNDASGIVWNLQDATVLTQSQSTSWTLASTTVKHYVAPITSRYVRLRMSTAFSGTGLIGVTAQFKSAGYLSQVTPVVQATAANLNATVVQPTAANLNATVTATNLSTNINQIAGSTPITTTPAGSTNKSLGVLIGGVVNNTDYSAQNWAAASGSGATISLGNGGGVSTSFLVNLTAFTAGSSTGLDIFLQWSPDGGTTWFDLWQCEALTATGAVFIPAIPIPGRRRFRWVNRTGAATTATVTITASDLPVNPQNVRQWFDRTAGVLAGTISNATSSYDVVGCKTINARIVLGTATTPATYQIQVSDDNTNWSNVGTATAAVASTSTTLSVTSIVARFARVIVTIAGSGQTGTYISITGSN